MFGRENESDELEVEQEIAAVIQPIQEVIIILDICSSLKTHRWSQEEHLELTRVDTENCQVKVNPSIFVPRYNSIYIFYDKKISKHRLIFFKRCQPTELKPKKSRVTSTLRTSRVLLMLLLMMM